METVTITEAVSTVSSIASDAFELLTKQPVIYFVGAALLLVGIAVAKRVVPMKRG